MKKITITLGTRNSYLNITWYAVYILYLFNCRLEFNIIYLKV